MDGLTLVQTATAAGLELRIDAGRLVVRGPKRLAELAAEVMRCKAVVMTALESPQPIDAAGPEGMADGDPAYSDAAEREAIMDKSREAAAVNPLFDNLIDNGDGTWSHPDFTPPETIAVDDLLPCSKCRSYLLRQSPVSLTWRCQHCDPPSERGSRLIELAAQLRQCRIGSQREILAYKPIANDLRNPLPLPASCG
jgi:hypothetical protein